MPVKKKLLLCGATGFIGRNVLAHFLARSEYQVYAVCNRRSLPRNLLRNKNLTIVRADLTIASHVERAVAGKDIVVQAAAATSGSKDIAANPHLHVTDNAVMNALIFRACHDHKVGHVIFFSCTIMYPSGTTPAKETDFEHVITNKYFGAGWTKVYNEKMCEFYSRIGSTKYTAIRHSNIYGSYDKYDLEKSHVFGATVAKVMNAEGGKVAVWGSGREARDLLYVDDLMEFLDACLARQKTPFELVNVGAGRAIPVADLVRKIISLSGKKLRIEFDKTKPTIPFNLATDCGRAKRIYGWAPKTSLDEGIKKSLRWYLDNYAEK